MSISTTNLDSGADSPRAARAQILAAVTAINDLSEDDTTKGSADVVQPTEYTDEQPTTVFSILRARANVKRFWVTADGDDWTNAFNKMLASGARNLIIPGDVAYESVGGHLILDDQDLYFEDAVIALMDDTARLFSAVAKSRWGIRGRVDAVGSLTTAASAVETGLYITDGKRYVVEGFTGRLMKGRAIHLAGSTAGTLRGDRGKFIAPSAYECTTGFQVDVGAGSEYNDWISPHASGCVTGFRMAAGNNCVTGGVIVDNTTGVKLTNGANHCHGAFIGTQINHNQSANIEAVGVINGHTFAGCHLYGNGTSTGPIWLNGCRGIVISGGIIDCWIYNDTGTGSGTNLIVNNYMPGDYGVTLTSNSGAAGLRQLYVSGNTSPTGPSAVNDPAPVFVHANRSSPTQSLSGAGTTLIFNNEAIDNRGAYDNATGIFTAPVAGVYVFVVSLTVTGTTLSTSYAEFVLNNTTTIGYMTLALNSSLIDGGRTREYPMAAGDTMRVKSTITGTSPVLATTTSSITISLKT